jgi:rhomboid protease GluP
VTRRTRRHPGTWFLSALILIGFAAQILTGAWKDPLKLYYLGAMVPELIVRGGEYWRLVTAIFLHGNGTPQGTLIHLGLNLFSLVNIGRIFEDMFGRRRLIVTFFVTGIAASVASLFWGAGWSVGASGAVFGVLGALMSLIWSSPRLRSDKGARFIMSQCVFVAIANIAIGLQIPQIDNAAHIGGLAAGLLLGPLFPHRTPPPPPSDVVVDVVAAPLDDDAERRRRSEPFDA